MTRLKLPIVAIVAVLLMGVAGLTFLAMGGDPDGESCLTRYVHAAASKIHGGHGSGGHGTEAGHHEEMSRMIEALQLTPEQNRHLERIHELMEAAHHGDGAGSMENLHEKLVAQFADGEVETSDLRAVVDAHVETVRGNLYAITDEFVALIKDLDVKQRQVLQEHLKGRARPSAS